MVVGSQYVRIFGTRGLWQCAKDFGPQTRTQHARTTDFTTTRSHTLIGGVYYCETYHHTVEYVLQLLAAILRVQQIAFCDPILPNFRRSPRLAPYCVRNRIRHNLLKLDKTRSLLTSSLHLLFASSCDKSDKAVRDVFDTDAVRQCPRIRINKLAYIDPHHAGFAPLPLTHLPDLFHLVVASQTLLYLVQMNLLFSKPFLTSTQAFFRRTELQERPTISTIPPYSVEITVPILRVLKATITRNSFLLNLRGL